MSARRWKATPVATEWHSYLRGHDVDGDWVHLRLEGSRGHWVQVLSHADGWELSGQAATATELAAADVDAAELWRRNRYLDLVGYVVDGEGSAWVTAWLPFAGVTAAEFREVAHHVAVEADRLEFYCTGRDEL